MEWFYYRGFPDEELELFPTIKNFSGGLKFESNNFFGPVLAGSIEQVIINPEARKMIQLYYSRYSRWFGKCPLVSFILENAYKGEEGLCSRVDKGVLAQEINSVAYLMEKEEEGMRDINVLYRLSNDFNCSITLLQWNSNPIYVEANSFINPVPLYFILTQEQDYFSLELLLGRKSEESKISSTKNSKIQNFISKSKKICKKYYLSNEEALVDEDPNNPNIPELPDNYEQIIPVQEEEEQILNRISQIIISPQIPIIFPELYKTIPKSENLVVTKTGSEPDPNKNIPEMEVPKIEFSQKYSRVSGPVKRPPKEWNSKNFPENFRIIETTVIVPLRFEPLKPKFNLPNTSFFSSLSTFIKDNQMVPINQIEEKKGKNKDDPIIVQIEDCDLCLQKHYSGVSLSCSCLLCTVCLYTSFCSATCNKCSFSFTKTDRDLIFKYLS